MKADSEGLSCETRVCCTSGVNFPEGTGTGAADCVTQQFSISSQVRQYVVQVVFSVTFAFSCTMFELIIFEILGALSST